MAKFFILVGFLSKIFVAKRKKNRLSLKKSLKITVVQNDQTNLITCNDFTMCFFDVLKKTNEIPESALGLHCIGSEDFHLIEWCLRVFGCGQAATNYSVLFKLRRGKNK